MPEKPVALKIGAHRYRLSYEDLIYDREAQQEYVGQCEHNTLTMRVKTGRSPSIMAETFLHETVHAISNDRRLDLSEHQVDQIAAAFLAMIVDNPDVFGEAFLQQWETT